MDKLDLQSGARLVRRTIARGRWALCGVQPYCFQDLRTVQKAKTKWDFDCWVLLGAGGGCWGVLVWKEERTDVNIEIGCCIFVERNDVLTILNLEKADENPCRYDTTGLWKLARILCVCVCLFPFFFFFLKELKKNIWKKNNINLKIVQRIKK